MTLGITGGIASGKSTVTKLFTGMGAVSISADEIAHALTQPGTPLTRAILETFGPEYAVTDAPETLDRRKLGRLVFQFSEERERLQALTRPPIMAEMARRAQEAHEMNPNVLIAAEIPLLFESNLVSFCDKTLVVACDAATQFSRLRARNPDLTEQDAWDRIHSQMPLGEKIALADYVISSEQSHEAMRADVRRCFDLLTASRV